MDDLSEADLHALIIARDEQAFAEWEKRTAPDALRAARKGGLTIEDAQEIWNDALAAVWRRAIKEPPIEPLGEGLRKYVFGAVSRIAANLIRKRQQQVETSSLDERDQLPNAAVWLPGQMPSKLVHAFRRCMETIDERSRIVLEMTMIKAPAADIAAALKISPNSVRKYVERAKKAIRSCVEGQIDV